MQRTVDKFAGVHQRAVLALPANVAKGKARAQAQVEVGYHRPVRSLQAGVGDVQAANLQRGGLWLTARKTPARGGLCSRISLSWMLSTRQLPSALLLRLALPVKVPRATSAPGGEVTYLINLTLNQERCWLRRH